MADTVDQQLAQQDTPEMRFQVLQLFEAFKSKILRGCSTARHHQYNPFFHQIFDAIIMGNSLVFRACCKQFAFHISNTM
eukprot:642738-Karenia_brevis.AAC.1